MEEDNMIASVVKTILYIVTILAILDILRSVNTRMKKKVIAAYVLSGYLAVFLIHVAAWTLLGIDEMRPQNVLRDRSQLTITMLYTTCIVFVGLHSLSERMRKH